MRPLRRTGFWPLAGSALLVATLAVGVVFDQQRPATAAPDRVLPPPPEDEGQQLLMTYFPLYPGAEFVPALGAMAANGSELRLGGAYVPARVEEVYAWYMDALQGEGRGVFGKLFPGGVSYVAYGTVDEPGRPRTLTLMPQGDGTMIFSSSADAEPILEQGQLPPDVPHPEGAGNVVSMNAGGGRTVRYVVSGKGPTGVADFYVANLAKAGWELKNRGPIPQRANGFALVFHRTGQSATIMVEPNDDASTAVTMMLVGDEADPGLEADQP